jgi:hypothetical protein
MPVDLLHVTEVGGVGPVAGEHSAAQRVDLGLPRHGEPVVLKGTVQAADAGEQAPDGEAHAAPG